MHERGQLGGRIYRVALGFILAAFGVEFPLGYVFTDDMHA